MLMRLCPNVFSFNLLLCAFVVLCSNASSQSAKVEVGKCGYYPDAHHGKKTASNEIYDKNQLTAAHKSHPFGTRLRVMRLDNKKSVEVRVNDRGPFMNGYVVDISGKAAEVIGLKRDGVAKVKVEVIGMEGTAPINAPTTASASEASRPLAPSLTGAPNTTSKGVSSVSEAASQLSIPGASTSAPPSSASAPVTHSTVTPIGAKPSAPASAAPAKMSVAELYQVEIKPVPPKTFGLQLAVLSSTDNLFQEIRKIQSTWPQKVIIYHEKTAGTTKFKLLLGPFNSRKEAEEQQKVAAKKGYPKSFIVEFE